LCWQSSSIGRPPSCRVTPIIAADGRVAPWQVLLCGRPAAAHGRELGAVAWPRGWLARGRLGISVPARNGPRSGPGRLSKWRGRTRRCASGSWAGHRRSRLAASRGDAARSCQTIAVVRCLGTSGQSVRIIKVDVGVFMMSPTSRYTKQATFLPRKKSL